MKKINYLEIDGRLLRLFLIVFEEQSVTRAAARLDLTQSAVSHGLEKLRKIIKDPLFVRSGRGITATYVAEQMVEDVRGLLRNMRSLSEPRGFKLEAVAGKFVIAASDILWPLLLSDLFIAITAQSPNLDLRIVNAGPDATNSLREGHFDLVLTPILPQGSEFKQQKLFEDEYVCFFDPKCTNAPKTLDDYLSRHHARIVFSTIETNLIDQLLSTMGKNRRVALQVPSFAGLPGLMKGTELIALLPSSIRESIMIDFDVAPSPVMIDDLKVYQIWHSRDDDSPLHEWIRIFLKKLALKI
ncbi:MAG TPA: LysR family transcriptional regulator [Rhodospirillales bacterium]|nr:LysR family transcriptional regulator [Rhodospirillales bacterium]